MFRLSATSGRLLILALFTGASLFSRLAPPADASATSINIIEPTDNPDDYTFERTSITVVAGDTVTWVNKGVETHSVTADGSTFDSKDIDAGRSWSYTFTTPGTYTYYCDPHPWMQGTVIVQ
jgi:plastocyanin